MREDEGEASGAVACLVYHEHRCTHTRCLLADRDRLTAALEEADLLRGMAESALMTSAAAQRQGTMRERALRDALAQLRRYSDFPQRRQMAELADRTLRRVYGTPGPMPALPMPGARPATPTPAETSNG